MIPIWMMMPKPGRGGGGRPSKEKKVDFTLGVKVFLSIYALAILGSLALMVFSNGLLYGLFGVCAFQGLCGFGLFIPLLLSEKEDDSSGV